MPEQATGAVAKAGAKSLFIILALFAVGWIALVVNKTETAADATCAMLLLATGIVPAVLWAWRWRETLPVMPIYGLVNILHFGLPFTSQTSDVLNYSDPGKLTGTLTVCAFLVAATVAWALIMSFVRIGRQSANLMNDNRIEGILPYGFAIAAIFSWAEMTGIAYSLDNALPVVRAVIGSAFSISAYLFGALWADGKLKAQTKILCATLLALAAVTTLSSLYLYPSMFVIAMFFMGYMISSRRVPVAMLVGVVAVFVVLQAGKSTMRNNYQDTQAVTSILGLPGFLAEWTSEGLFGLTQREDQGSVELSDRIGLMHMLLRAQAMTPSQVDFLDGETYAIIPRLIIPRFLDPEKPIAHAGLIMLNIRYGLFLPEEVVSTSIGWGMLPEAYANFGYIGVICLGLLLGALFGVVTRWASGSPALSARAMFGVIFLLIIFNLEADTALFVTTLLQSAVAVFLIDLILRNLARNTHSLPSRAHE